MENPAGSPEKWRDALAAELIARRSRITKLENYYNGDHPLPAPPKRLQPTAFNEARRAYAALMTMGVTNWVKLVADAPAERLEVVDLRFGDEGRPSSEPWDIWQENELDSQSLLVHDNALQTGQSFAMTDPVSGVITCEHSAQMIVAYAPGSRRTVVAALKLWNEDDDAEMATLLLPNSIHKWEKRRQFGPSDWSARSGVEETVIEHGLGVVTVVEFAANPTLRPRMFGGGCGEFETVLPIQDRINKTVFDRLVTAEFQAFRQRYIIGWSPDIDETTGLPKAEQVQRASQAGLWTFDGEPADIQIGELSQADFAAFLKATEADVNAMAAISKTPPHYLLGAMVNISGDALTAAESGLASKTRKHARNFGPDWVQVIRHALLVQGSELAADPGGQAIWRDVEHRTWGEQVDAVMKMGADPIRVPRRALWEKLPDVSPQDIARWDAFEETGSLLSGLTVDDPDDGSQ